MDWINTPESSNIQRFRYDPHSQILKVEFKNSGVYEYYDVPSHMYEGMAGASSKGQFLASQIKGAYRYARV